MRQPRWSRNRSRRAGIQRDWWFRCWIHTFQQDMLWESTLMRRNRSPQGKSQDKQCWQDTYTLLDML